MTPAEAIANFTRAMQATVKARADYVAHHEKTGEDSTELYNAWQQAQRDEKVAYNLRYKYSPTV